MMKAVLRLMCIGAVGNQVDAFREGRDRRVVVLLRTGQRPDRLVNAVEAEQRLQRRRGGQLTHRVRVEALPLIGERELVACPS